MVSLVSCINSSMDLVIVESPTKAKTIKKFLGPEYAVVASMGHVRDLPSSQDEVPAEYKKTPTGQLGVDVEHDFKPLYVVSSKKTKIVTELKKLMKTAQHVYLATDPDREGESISWHLMEILKPKVPVARMVFHEINKEAIMAALSHTRDIDENLVHAQEARRILDRLVGYTVSPVLWKKIAFGLSAGRVQSAALKAIVDRERLRMAFRKGSYWDVTAELEKGLTFDAKLMATGGKKVATGKDFDENTGTVKAGSETILIDEDTAKHIAAETQALPWKVTDIVEKDMRRKAPAPFTTSTLQQECNRKLGLSSRDAMRTAQSLYEHGFITYMRTDSVVISDEALKAIHGVIDSRFGKEYLSTTTKKFEAQAGAQEAHEAIRPSLNFTAPHETNLTGAERDVYELIWMRAVASQMRDAEQLQQSVSLEVGTHRFQATGLRIIFPGFLRAYVEGADDVEQALEDKEKALPELKIGDVPNCVKTEALGHETKPPARFTEAALVQYMEKEGIGRPSTYAATIGTLTDRGYIRKHGNALVPSFTAFAVTQLLEKHLSDLVDVRFTSQMERSLDQIAEGKQAWLPYLQQFFLGEKGLQNRLKTELDSIEPEEAKTIVLPQLQGVRVKVGKFGPYVEGNMPNTGALMKGSLPEDATPGDINMEQIATILADSKKGPTSLGVDPVTGQYIYLRTGSYGPYLQLGEEIEDAKKKPKRVSIPKNVPLETLNLEKALLVLSLPRLLGTHPETTKEIRAGLGRFGPYIVHDGDFRSLKAEDDVLTVTFERALELLAIPKGTRGRGAAGKEIGKDPNDGKPVTLHDGKYGAYVKHGTTNATIPKDWKPEDVTLDKALKLIAEREEKAPPKKTRTKKAVTKKKAA